MKVKQTITTFLVAVCVLTTSCGNKKCDWQMYESERTMFYNSYMDPFDKPGELQIAKDKTALEMLQMQASFADKSNDSTLYYLTYSPRNSEPKLSNTESSWEITKVEYIIRPENFNTSKTVLNKFTKVDTLKFFTEREAYEVADDYARSTNSSNYSVYTATLRELK